MAIIPAAALNRHKVQGLTADSGIVYEPTGDKIPWQRASEYVAISRCTSISDNKLILIKPLRSKHFTALLHEYAWIREAYENFAHLNDNFN